MANKLTSLVERLLVFLLYCLMLQATKQQVLHFDNSSDFECHQWKCSCDLTGLEFVQFTVHKRSSRYIKGIVIGAVSMLGFGIIFLLGFLWIWLLTKKERAAKKYTEVKKQVHQDPS